MHKIVCLLFLLVSPFAWGQEQAVELKTGTGVIHGSLLLPEAAGKPPVALIISGSGPTDRNGNNPGMQNDSLKILAGELAKAGIATLRFDKRGIAQSAAAAPREEDLRFGTYVDDARAWLAQLAADPRFRAVYVIGHSEGALIGLLAAHQAKLAGYVSIAGTSKPAAQLLRGQLAARLPSQLQAVNEKVLAELEAGRLVKDVPPELAMLYRPSVQPYMVSWFAVAPLTAAAQLKTRALFIQGDTDLQVGVDDATALSAAAPGSRKVLVAGMNHVLKMAGGDLQAQLPSYMGNQAAFAMPLVAEIAAFMGAK